MRSYTLRHPHANQKPAALAILKQLLSNLGIDQEVPLEPSPVIMRDGGKRYELCIGHSKSYVTAVIHVYTDPKPDLELTFVTITDGPDRRDMGKF